MPVLLISSIVALSSSLALDAWAESRPDHTVGRIRLGLGLVTVFSIAGIAFAAISIL